MADELAKLKRRIRQLEHSREAWKARAVVKQGQVRRLLVKTRDLARSRDRWKGEARPPGEAAPDEPPCLLPLPAGDGQRGRGGKRGHRWH